MKLFGRVLGVSTAIVFTAVAAAAEFRFIEGSLPGVRNACIVAGYPDKGEIVLWLTGTRDGGKYSIMFVDRTGGLLKFFRKGEKTTLTFQFDRKKIMSARAEVLNQDFIGVVGPTDGIVRQLRAGTFLVVGIGEEATAFGNWSLEGSNRAIAKFFDCI